MEEKDIKYSNEEDKSYGLTGMAISVVVWDCEHLLSAVSIDAQADEAIEMMPEYYFSGNPAVSAKTSWSRMLQNFQLSTAMLLANVMCRRMVYRRQQMNSDIREGLLRYVLEEGRESCSLDDDESTKVFDKCYSYCNRLFSHYGVMQIADEFARTLRDRRRMTRSEVIEALSALNGL
ncbi:MAG: hypothetical protein K2L49_01420 [Muribaculaceae bacterium]|nr:hypothetical protein [Muribaculaceae bacterium]